MTRVIFHDRADDIAGKLDYSVTAARYKGKWIFVRKWNKDTWELCVGHIEEGESPAEAARRELMEETGAREFDLKCIATYSVEKDGETGYGRLYFAEVESIDEIPDRTEIAEIQLFDFLPDKLTYPDIQNHLFRKVLGFLEKDR